MPKKSNKSNGNGAADTSVTIQVVLDRSGSMESVRDATIEGYNAYLVEQKKLAGARFGLTQFDHDGRSCIDVVYVDVPVEKVVTLNRDSYRPRGGTPLYDAIGVTIAALETRHPAGKVVFVIVTDGEENSSREWTHQRVFDKIAQKRAEGWEFVFMGANVDAYVAGEALGVAASAIHQYDSTPASVLHAYASVSASTTSYRTGRTDAMVLDPDEMVNPANDPRGRTSKRWSGVPH